MFIMNIQELPKTIPVFPLSNFIMFPGTSVPLNIFEPRYLQMVNDCMKNNRIIGMIQPKKSGDIKKPDLYEVGCIGKVSSFNETEDGRILIILNGVCRFKTIRENMNNKLYREFLVDYSQFQYDLEKRETKLEKNDISTILNNLKTFFKKQGYIINLKNIRNKSDDETLNDISMASPFSLEEKQIILESKNLDIKKQNILEILNNYIKDDFNNTTIQ